MTKKQIIAYFSDLGYQCSYSGHTRTIYVHKIAAFELGAEAAQMGGEYPFTLKAD